MFRFILWRMVWMLPFLLAISFISFVLIQLPPGDYVTTYIATLAASNEIVDQTPPPTCALASGWTSP